MNESELLIELGMEEVPAWMLGPAAAQFSRALVDELAANRLHAELSSVWYTPRRIAVALTGIAGKQEDLSETLMGPPRSVAFDAGGRPSRAAEAFSRKSGIPLGKLRVVTTPKGEYLGAVRKVKGEKARAILERVVPAAISAIQFPKTMHWSPDKFRFARPLRWIVALFGGRTLKFAVAGVHAGRHTSGHRFLGLERVAVASAEELRTMLAANGVIIDPAERRRRIEEGLAREASAAGGVIIPDAHLLETVVNLNECPSVIRGGFESRFLDLPQEILVTVMREHQKYFSVVDGNGKLLPAFLAVINLEIPDTSKIRAGHERVLRARLADAAFFWETDRKTALDARLESLRNVLFQEKLGSYHAKTERVRALVPRVAESAGLAAEIPDLIEAAGMMKCDLVTEMVKEFTDLQGIVGGLYARAEGRPESVWRPIYEQYMPKASSAPSPSTGGSAILSLADKLDTVSGCFSIGLVPTGSKDPFAVRRAGNGILKIVLDRRIQVSLQRLASWGVEAFPGGPAASAELLKFLEGRLRFLLEEAGFAYDCINAGLAAGWDDPVDAADRVKALQSMHAEEDFLSVASNFKRIENILSQSTVPETAPDPALMTDVEERALWKVYTDTSGRLEECRSQKHYEKALRLLASMRGPVDAFFDKVLVMAEDPAVRLNRVAMLGRLAGLFRSVGDISQIVLGGGRRT
jgi:glycyl-tRNA synthetase beta chain